MTKVINKNEFNSKLFSKKEIKKIMNAERIDDKEEYFVINAIKIHNIIKINPNLKDITKIIPKKVETPFPPLNFNQTGNMCPRKDARPDK